MVFWKKNKYLIFFIFLLMCFFTYFAFAVVPKERLRVTTSQAASICREIAMSHNKCATSASTELENSPDDPWGNHFRCKQEADGNVAVFSRDYNVYDGGGRAQIVCKSEGKQLKNGCFCKVSRL